MLRNRRKILRFKSSHAKRRSPKKSRLRRSSKNQASKRSLSLPSRKKNLNKQKTLKRQSKNLLRSKFQPQLSQSNLQKRSLSSIPSSPRRLRSKSNCSSKKSRIRKNYEPQKSSNKRRTCKSRILWKRRKLRQSKIWKLPNLKQLTPRKSAIGRKARKMMLRLQSIRLCVVYTAKMTRRRFRNPKSLEVLQKQTRADGGRVTEAKEIRRKVSRRIRSIGEKPTGLISLKVHVRPSLKTTRRKLAAVNGGEVDSVRLKLSHFQMVLQ